MCARSRYGYHLSGGPFYFFGVWPDVESGYDYNYTDYTLRVDRERSRAPDLAFTSHDGNGLSRDLLPRARGPWSRWHCPEPPLRPPIPPCRDIARHLPTKSPNTGHERPEARQ